MRIVRTILIILVGGILTYLTYKTKYQSFFFEAILWSILVIIGLLIFAWSISKDVKLFKKEKRIKKFALTFISLFFIAVISLFEIKINNNFNKPTLLKAFNDGDYNGTSIDLKIDGTYIFENSAIGISDYFYGKYNVNGNKITMDRNTIDNLTNFKYLEIKNKQIEENKTELYLFQVDSLGNSIDKSQEYRVTIDNRKK